MPDDEISARRPSHPRLPYAGPGPHETPESTRELTNPGSSQPVSRQKPEQDFPPKPVGAPTAGTARSRSAMANENENEPEKPAGAPSIQPIVASRRFSASDFDVAEDFADAPHDHSASDDWGHPGAPDHDSEPLDDSGRARGSASVRGSRALRSPATLGRAIRLLALTAFMPGRAQVVAGPRPLGRIATLVTVFCWAAILLTGLGMLFFRGATLNTLLNPGVAAVVSTLLVFLAIGWALLFAATVRAARPGRLGAGRAAVVVVISILLAALTSGSLIAGSTTLSTTSAAFDKVFTSTGSVSPSNGRYNILLLGGDAGADRTGRRPDSMSVMSIDATTGDTVTIGLPRNLQNAPFPDDSPMKSVYPEGYNCGDGCILNTLYGLVNSDHTNLYPGVADPGAQATMEAASAILGIRVNSYMLVDMGGFSELVDAMGGVKVTSGGWVPVTAGEIPGVSPVRHYPPSEWMAPGVLTLDGYHAEWFARSREFTSDYNRIKRQQCVQAAIMKKLSPSVLATRFGPIAEAGAKLAETNIPRGEVGYFLDTVLRSRGHEVRRLTVGEPDFPPLFSTYPDFDKVHTRVAQLIAASGGASAHGGSSGAGSSGFPLAAARPASVQLPEQYSALSVPAADTAPDGTKVTPEYLTQLAKNWDDSTLGAILGDNGNCSPAE